ncbi:MAG: RDD family protein [Nitrososphaeria archaeon]
MPYCTKCGKLIPDGAAFCPNCGAPILEKVAPPTPSPHVEPVSGIDAIAKSQQARDYWMRRVIAFVIDSIVISGIVGIMTAIALIPHIIAQAISGKLFTTPWSWVELWSFPFIVGIGLILYYSLSEITWGATLGKSIMRLKVTNVNGEKPDLGQAFLRNISKIYWLLLLLDVIIGLAIQVDYKQKLSDKYAGTVVISK